MLSWSRICHLFSVSIFSISIASLLSLAFWYWILTICLQLLKSIGWLVSMDKADVVGFLWIASQCSSTLADIRRLAWPIYASLFLPQITLYTHWDCKCIWSIRCLERFSWILCVCMSFLSIFISGFCLYYLLLLWHKSLWHYCLMWLFLLSSLSFSCVLLSRLFTFCIHFVLGLSVCHSFPGLCCLNYLGLLILI